MLGYGALASVVVAALAICVVLILNYVIFPWRLRGKGKLERLEAAWSFVGIWAALILLATILSGEGLVDGVIGFGSLSMLPFLCYLSVGAKVWPRDDGKIRGN